MSFRAPLEHCRRCPFCVYQQWLNQFQHVQKSISKPLQILALVHL